MKLKIFTLLQGSPVACRKNKTRTTYLSDKPEVVVTLARCQREASEAEEVVPVYLGYVSLLKLLRVKNGVCYQRKVNKKSSGLPMNRFPHCLQTITKSHTVSNHNYSLQNEVKVQFNIKVVRRLTMTRVRASTHLREDFNETQYSLINKDMLLNIWMNHIMI